MTGDINEQIEISVTDSTIQPDENEINQRRALNVFLSCVISGLLLYAVSLLFKYIPNGLDTAYIQKIFYVNPVLFVPENPERIGYIILVCLFPILFTLTYWVINKIKIKSSIVNICSYFYIAILIYGIYIFYDINSKNPYLYKYSMLSDKLNLVIVVSFISIIAIYFYRMKYKRLIKIIDYICLIVCLCTALFVASLFITKIYGLNYKEFINFDAYYYPVFEVFNGKTLIHDFNNIYGFYPYFIVPILKLTGSITILKFSIIMAILVLMILISFFIIIWLNVKNKIIAFIGYFTLIFFAFILPLSIVNGFYLAYQPHRIFFPALIILLCCILLYVKNPNHKRILTIAGFCISTLSLIWNLDTGIVVTGAWCLFLIYNIALSYSFNDIKFYKKSLPVILITILSAVSSYIILALITYFRSGELIGIKACFYAQHIFYNVGFNMLPLPQYHPWIILISLYVLGLIISLPNIKFLNNNKVKYTQMRASMYFLISIIGLGLFVYYQGRSHDKVFTAVNWPGIILVIMFLQDCFYKHRNIKEKKIQEKIISYAYLTKFILITVLCVSYVLTFLYAFKDDITLTGLYKRDSYLYADTIKGEYDIIKSTIGNDKNVDLFIYQKDYFYTMLGIENPTGLPSNIDWFTRGQYDKALDRLENTANIVIFDDGMVKLFNEYNGERLNQIISNRFDKRELGAGLTLYAIK